MYWMFRLYSRYLLLKRTFKHRYWLYRYKENLSIDASATLSSEMVFRFANSESKATLCEKVEILPYSTLNILRNGHLILHKNVFVNSYCSLNCLEKIEIGENTLLGEGVRIYDHNHIYNHEGGSLTTERHLFSSKPVLIGKNCWIGSGVVILKGVEIGDNVIIGANTLVYKSISSNSLVKSNQSYTITA